MTKRAGLLDLTGAAPLRQAHRDAAAGTHLAQIAAGVNALVAIEQEQLILLRDIARMTWEQSQRATP